MYLTLQCTLTCHACGKSGNPVNARVDAVTCLDCGAAVAIPEDTWTAALEGVVQAAADLSEQARGHQTLNTEGGAFRIGYARLGLSCPHCSTAWDAPPDDSCPSCATPISIRAAPGAPEGIGVLIGEDRGLLLPGTELAFGCRNCGAPLDAGAEREVTCSACDAQTIVPDEVWRRLNAPELAATWFVEVHEAGSDNPLSGQGIDELAVGPDGTVYAVGQAYPLDCVITAFDANLTRRLWTHEIPDADLSPIPVPLGDGRVALLKTMTNEVLVADAKGVSPYASVPGEPLVDGANTKTGLIVSQGHFRTLKRLSPAGALASPWPPVGCLARLLGRGDGPAAPDPVPGKRPTGTLAGRAAGGHDGQLRLAWGRHLVHYDAEGGIRSKHTDPSWGVTIVAPAGAADGTTYAAFTTADQRYAIVRVPPGGTPEVVHRTDHCCALACQADGRLLAVWGDHVEDVGTTFRLTVWDAAGNTIKNLRLV